MLRRCRNGSKSVFIFSITRACGWREVPWLSSFLGHRNLMYLMCNPTVWRPLLISSCFCKAFHSSIILLELQLRKSSVLGFISEFTNYNNRHLQCPRLKKLVCEILSLILQSPFQSYPHVNYKETRARGVKYCT